MNEQIKNWNIPEIVNAVIADDPEAAQIADTLAQSLADIQAGKYSPVAVSPVTATRQKTGLSQSKFAAALNISPNTLKSWEQGQRKPSGAAAALLNLLGKHPDLVHELGA
ncbi:MAG: helix-turn-helix domain-containing protein [Neisseria sp.]|nr:helix-turn-helix domain-containing protein [Neisseria sp.]